MATADKKPLKMLLVGNMNSGKTTLMNRMARNNVPTHSVATIGFEYSGFSYNYDDDVNVRLNVWDAAGMERFRGILKMYYRGIDVCVIVLDDTDYDAIEHARYWIRQSRKYTDVPLLLVVNKTDIMKPDWHHPWLELCVEQDVAYIMGSAIYDTQQQWMRRFKPFLLQARKKQEALHGGSSPSGGVVLSTTTTPSKACC